MIGFFLNASLAVIWVALSGSFSFFSLTVGLILGYVVLAIVQPQIPAIQGYAQRIPRIIRFILFFVVELAKANWRVGFDVVTPTLHMRPGVIGVPLEAKTDMEITMVANFISLTPGTLSLDVSDDRKVLYIHAMFLQDEAALRREISILQHRILEVMR